MPPEKLASLKNPSMTTYSTLNKEDGMDSTSRIISISNLENCANMSDLVKMRKNLNVSNLIGLMLSDQSNYC